MDLKFYLNKFLKVDNIENYTLNTLSKLREKYEKFLEKTEGLDPDFPNIDFSGGKKGKKLKGRSMTLGEEDTPSEHKNIL